MSQARGSDGASGTLSAPVQTVGEAISIAASAGEPRTVYLDEGTYLETLLIDGLSAAVRVEGSWEFDGSTWARDCDPTAISRTVIKSDDATAIRLEGLDSAVTLANLEIRGKDLCQTESGGAGESCITVMAVDSDVALDRVSIFAGPGGDGKAVDDQGPSGFLDCNRIADCGNTIINAGADGDRGCTPLAMGEFRDGAYLPAGGGGGGDGIDGENGNVGMAGETGDCFGDGFCGTCAGSCLDASPYSGQAGTGLCGCGGEGGAGGPAGFGGGASVALLLSGDSEGLVSDSRLVAGNGGNGSNGGSGGKGSAGSSGEPGGDHLCYAATACAQGGTPCSCSPTGNDFGFLAGGSAGTSGSGGGDGGDGGGGAGGPSFAIVRAAGATTDVSRSQLDFGDPGLGGGGAPGGQSGANHVASSDVSALCSE